jgi:RimJ/RimL family protein N-acetyltransferase
MRLEKRGEMHETERLVLRQLAPADDGFILALVNDPDFLRNIGDKGVRTLSDARDYIANGPAASYARYGFGLYLVARRADGAPLGICGLIKRDALDDVDLGFAFLPRFRSQGYAAEAAGAVIAQGRDEFGLARLAAITIPENAPSIRLLERLGFRFERMIRFSAEDPELRLFLMELRGNEAGA